MKRGPIPPWRLRVGLAALKTHLAQKVARAILLDPRMSNKNKCALLRQLEVASATIDAIDQAIRTDQR